MGSNFMVFLVRQKGMTPVLGKFIARTKRVGSCWIWQGAIGNKSSLSKKGYGNLKYRGRYYRAHRLFYILHFGNFPQNKWVLHRCNTPPCVNPKHLYLGTARDNNIDTVRAGHNGLQKLNPSKVRRIRQLYRKGVRGFGQLCTARRFGVSETVIQRIIYRKTWGWVD